MIFKEAIEILDINAICSPRATQFKKAVDLAKEALEKQIPKKPVKTRREIVCPTCRTLVGSNPYCKYCGQALDWENEK